MSSAGDSNCFVNLDANIEVETLVRNRFEELEESYPFDSLYNHISVLSDEDLPDSSVDSEASTAESKEPNNKASDRSENYVSTVSDISAESPDSMVIDNVSAHDEIKEQTSSKADVFFLDSRIKYVNCKELIVFCIDMSSDMEKVPFKLDDEGKFSPLSMVKRAISMFVHNKHFIDKKHEFSLMILYQSATWVCEFTSNPKKLIDALDDLTETLDCISCDLSSVISLLSEKCPFILSTDYKPPDIQCVLRVILIYSHSNCMIEFSDPGTKEVLLKCPSLFLDVVYVHELQSEKNKCAEIFENLCNLDERKISYIFETTRSITSLLNIMGKLLSHPFQRVPQIKAIYELPDITNKY